VIPLFDLRLEESDVQAVASTLRSGWLTMGPRTEEFERAFAAHLGVNHVVALSNGTAALHLAYLAAGVGPGSEVIVPSFTFVATANAAVYCGATPVFADIVDPARPVIDPLEVQRLIGPRTRAVVAVHFAGYAAAVDELAEICTARGVSLIEDAAHAPTATLGGQQLGTFGLAGAFSLFSNKVLSVGEGGMLATNDPDVAARVASLRSHAMSSGTWSRHQGHSDSYDVVDIGFNYRMDEPRAALALARLSRLETEVRRRRELISMYRERLRDVPGVQPCFEDGDVATTAGYVMPVMLDDPDRRALLRQAMRERHDVQTSVLYPAIHHFSAYRKRQPGLRLPRTEVASARELTLPLFAHMTEKQQEQVVAALTSCLATVPQGLG